METEGQMDLGDHCLSQTRKKIVKGTIMVAAATIPDKTEEEETNFMRWGKMIRKWSPSLKTIGKTICNGNSRCKHLKDM